MDKKELHKSVRDREDFLQHYGVLGMRWGYRKDRRTGKMMKTSELKALKKQRRQEKDPSDSLKKKAVAGAYATAAKVNPRELKYTVKRTLTRHTDDDKAVVSMVNRDTKQTGVLTTNEKMMAAVDREGIAAHKAAKYDNLNSTDIKNLKRYTDSAAYSRSVNAYLATGEPKDIATTSAKLKETISKNTISDTTVYRSTSLKFSTEGLSRKLDALGEETLAKTFDQFDKNFKGKSFSENRVYSTSTSPTFAIDTWRKVNPNAAKTYNTYLVINTKGTPGLLADGRTSSGGKIVNTRSNQEAILAPNKMTYTKIAYDHKRQMFAVHLDAT